MSRKTEPFGSEDAARALTEIVVVRSALVSLMSWDPFPSRARSEQC